MYISSEVRFYSVKDIKEMTGWSHTTVEKLFSDPKFPSSDPRSYTYLNYVDSDDSEDLETLLPKYDPQTHTTHIELIERDWTIDYIYVISPPVGKVMVQD